MINTRTCQKAWRLERVSLRRAVSYEAEDGERKEAS